MKNEQIASKENKKEENYRQTIAALLQPMALLTVNTKVVLIVR